ncbi:MAG: Ig-like domain-containing protein [Pirellulales bacterium]
MQSNTRLEAFGPLMLQVPTRGGVDIVDGRLFTISNNGRTVIFEFDNNGFGPSSPGNVLVRYTPTSTANDVALAIIAAIQSTALGLTPINLGGGKIELGILNTSQVVVGSTGMTTSRGVVSDGESFTIDNGTTAITFEFDNVDLSNGSTAGRTPILFRSNSTPDSVVATMKAVIEGTTLGLTTTVMPNGVIQLNDTPRFVITTTNAPSLRKTGVPGGANAVFFIQDATFTADMVKRSIITAVNNALNTNLQASDRGGSTLFLENAISVSPEIDNYYLQGVSDLAGNALKPNRINNETEFTILMPGAELDYGDAPDPFTTTGGRYPTERANDGARHVISQGTAWLGTTADADNDGNPTPAADGDVGDDGVSFGSALNPQGLFNRFITTNVTVTMNSPGYVDGWIDFNADGDWDDPGEKILDSVQFVSGNLTQTFAVTVPATAPVPLTATTTFARFRSSTTGGLLPTGLAVDGEVEDYQVTVVPGTPPTAVNDAYTINEDSLLLTTDADGAASPGFVIDDGIAANDTDPEGGPFQVALVTGPTHAQSFTLNPDGTFTYVPAADFNGTDVFTYRVKDGVLTSNNFGTVTITVREVNDAPTANNDTVLTDEDSPLTLLDSQLISNDSAGPAEESGQTLHVTGVQSLSAAGGNVSLSGGRVIYTPPADFSGTDTFTYTITDNGTSIGLPAPLSATATVTVTVRDVNDAPITGGDTIGPVVEDGSIGVSTGTLLGNDAAGPLNETLVQAIRMNRVIATSTHGGTVTLSGTTVTYRPAPDFAGTDTFFYEVVDNGLSNGVSDPKTALGTVTVTVTPVNDAPRVANSLGTVTVVEDSPARTFDLSTYFFDPDVITNGDVLTYSVKSNTNANLATPTISANTLTVPLVADANGQAVITIEAADSTGAKITNTLTLNVTPVNDAPRLVTAIPDQTMAEDETPRTITLSPTFFRDPDVASNGDRLTYSLTENTNSLLVTPTLNSSGDLTLTLSANQFGTSQISVKVTDLAGLFVTDTFILTVNPVNDAPVGRADSYTVAQGGTLITTDLRGSTSTTADDSVLVNDNDIESDPLTAVLVTGPQFGTVTLNSNGTFTYVHTGSTRTTDTFTYRPNDGALSGNLTTVTITIGAPAAPPHQNPLTVGSESSDGHRDVNADGFISPIDALLVINFLNTEGPRSVVGLPSPPPYRDVNGDNFISAIDALLVINYLNSLRPSGEGESEAVPAGDVQTGNWLAAAYANEFVATLAASSSYVSMRARDLAQGEIYGPVQPVMIRDEVVEAIAETGLTVDSDVAALLAAEPVHSGDSAGAVDSAISELLGDLFPKIDKKS